MEVPSKTFDGLPMTVEVDDDGDIVITQFCGCGNENCENVDVIYIQYDQARDFFQAMCAAYQELASRFTRH